MLTLVLLCAVGQAAPAEDGEAQLLKYRTALTSGRMTISGRNRRPAHGLDKQWVRRIWYDDKHFRCDYTVRKKGKAVRRGQAWDPGAYHNVVHGGQCLRW
jgi:hypothetical protein